MTENAPALRRNMVAYVNTDNGILYGRIVRILPDGFVEIIDCGKYFRKVRAQDITLAPGYKGKWDSWGEVRDQHPVWLAMPTLRKLKQITAQYNQFVWKKNRKGRINIYNAGDHGHYWHEEAAE